MSEGQIFCLFCKNPFNENDVEKLQYNFCPKCGSFWHPSKIAHSDSFLQPGQIELVSDPNQTIFAEMLAELKALNKKISSIELILDLANQTNWRDIAKKYIIPELEKINQGVS